MAHRDFRDASRERWGFPFADDVTTLPSLTTEQVNCGSLLRIADAAELAVRRFQGMIDENERMKKQLELNRLALNGRDRQIAALRGVISKMKKKSCRKP